MVDVLNKLNPLAIVIIITIVGILISSIVISIILRNRYKDLHKDLQMGKNDLDSGRYANEVLNAIVKDYRERAKSNAEEVNTQAIIESNFYKFHRNSFLAERFFKNAVSLMIILGLLGTFYGLTISIAKLVELLSNSANVEVLSSMDSIVGGLIEAVKGMSVAFVTSLFGIASSIVVTFINILFNIDETKEAVMVDIEEFLDNKVALEFKKENEYTYIAEDIKNTMGSLGDKIEYNFKNVMDNSGKNLTAATREMENTTLSMLKAVKLFNESLNTFAENTKDFSQFNHELRTNIQRMNVTFGDFTNEIKEITDKK